MLIVNPIAAGAGRYYFGGQGAGRWCGAARHDLGLDGPVTPAALASVLGGRRPGDGAALSARRTPHRRAGWDLIFTAPKSVSLLAALGPPEARDTFATAHRRACADAFGWLEDHGCWARRRGGTVATTGFVAARFGHAVNAAGEPHLHTHVLVANVAHAKEGGWSAVDGSGMWLNRRAVSGIYHLALRQQLLAAGLRPDWALAPDGAADIAGVPRRAIEATSTRRRQIRGRLDGLDDPAPLTRTAAQRLSRHEAPTGGSWAARSAVVGFGPDEARRVIDEAGRQARNAPPDSRGDGADRRLADAVVGWLADRRSTFGLVDVIQALSAHHVEGATGADASQWARAFLAASPRAADGRWTSARAIADDDALLRAAMALAGTGAGVVATAVADPTVRRLTTSGNGVETLGPPRPSTPADGWRVTMGKGAFVAQAEVIDAARVVWQRAGRTVAVDTPSEGAARRWRALAGLDRYQAGEALPTVLVVDRADRRTTGELQVLVDDAARCATKLVLVTGGTRPARRAPISQGLDRLDRRREPVVAVAGTVPPGSGDGVTAGRLHVFPLGRQALQQVAATWAQGHDAGRSPRMVALGPPECDELNRRARSFLRRAGAITGEEVDIGGRPFAVGDSVVATRRGALPAGAVGTVSRVDPEGSLLVDWSGPPARIDAWTGRSLRHAYAVTPGMLHFDARPVVALAEPSDLGPHQRRVVAAGLVAAASPRTASRPDRAGGTLVEARIRVGEIDPTAAGLDPTRLGPLPGDAGARHRWRTDAGRQIDAAELHVRHRDPGLRRRLEEGYELGR
jgi:conjugative relaxase-like TrwC/TraI family protein